MSLKRNRGHGGRNTGEVRSDLAAAVDNKSVWGHAISGKIILAGSDPEDHAPSRPGAQTYIARAIAFAAKRSGRTGFYFAGDYYRVEPSSPQHVKVLDALVHQGFYWRVEDENTIHIDPAVRPHPHGLSDITMSGWGNTAHEAFTKWPKKKFHVWAIGVDPAGNWTTSDHVTGWAQFLVGRL